MTGISAPSPFQGEGRGEGSPRVRHRPGVENPLPPTPLRGAGSSLPLEGGG